MSTRDPHEDATTMARPVAAGMFAPAYLLSVTSGPDTGKTFRVTPSAPSRSLIGKSTACDIRLSDGAVSRRHASVEVADGKLRVIDLGSTNGTHVGGVRIFSAEIGPGETIHLGATTLRVEADTPTHAEPISRDGGFGTTVGSSRAMRRLYPLCERLAHADVPVVLEGETGTGKEQLAESLHLEGRRRDGPFVVFDCTAIAPTLIEAELFGHEKGAYTGATMSRGGFFEQAHGGTLLIDEIGDLPIELQSKLLRAIERLQVVRVGGRTPLTVDVRVLASTRRDLDREVAVGRFRDDLFHRIAVARIELPPLRERHGDIPLLARHFVRELTADETALPDELLRRWEDYPWPGNVRELKNAVARRIALGDLAPDSVDSSASVPPPAAMGLDRRDPIGAVLALGLPLAEARQRLVVEFERRYAENLLSLHGGNVTRAAAAAGIARRHFYRLRGR